MEELKNLKNFNEFKGSLNEELLWGAIKNLFSKLFGKMDQKLADAVNNFTKKIDASKTWDESVKIFEAETNNRKTMAETNINAAKTLMGLRKAMADSSEALFVELQVLANKYQIPNLAAKKVFEGQPEAQMFNKDNSEGFKTTLIGSLNAKIIELNKNNQGGYDENTLKTYLDGKKNIDEGDPTTSAPTNPTTPTTASTPTTPTDPTGKNAVSVNSDDTSTYDNYNRYKLDNLSKIFEQASGVTTMDGPLNQNLKAPAIKWVIENLNGIALKKVKETPKPAGTTGTDPYDQIAKTSKATGNTDSLSKLLRNIVQLPTAGDLAKVRDYLAGVDGNTKDPNFKDSIGKF